MAAELKEQAHVNILKSLCRKILRYKHVWCVNICTAPRKIL